MEKDWLDDVVEKIAGDLGPVRAQEAGLRHLAGRALAEDIIAPFDLPASDLSSMDGYAVRREDLALASADAPVALGLAGFLKAGDLPRAPLARGECLKVATGATLPIFSDAVVVEESAEEREGKVFFREQPGGGQFIKRRASFFRSGQKAAALGDLVGAGEVAIMASFGLKSALVFGRPRISIIATGDELVMPGCEIKGGQLYASNLYLLAALAEGYGAEVVCLDIVGDDADEIARRLCSETSSDMAVITGGTATGRFDVTLTAFKTVGGQVLVSGLKARPCDKFCAGRLGGKPMFFLPGRPEAAEVNFGLFVKPSIMKMAGFSNYKNRKLKVIYDGNRLKIAPLMRFLRAKLWVEGDHLLARLEEDEAGRSRKATPLPWRSVLVCPPNSPPIAGGYEVDLVLIS